MLCRECHVINDSEHPNPKDAKLRKIPPLAPSANPKRLTDFDHVEQFLKPNCEMVFGRVRRQEDEFGTSAYREQRLKN